MACSKKYHTPKKMFCIDCILVTKVAFHLYPKGIDSRGDIFGCLLGGEDAIWAYHGADGNVSEEQVAG